MKPETKKKGKGQREKGKKNRGRKEDAYAHA
jgi:hypothetical protein